MMFLNYLGVRLSFKSAVDIFFNLFETAEDKLAIDVIIENDEILQRQHLVNMRILKQSLLFEGIEAVKDLSFDKY